MIIVMKSTASKEDVEKVSGSVEKLGLRENVVNGATQSVIGIIGDTTKVDPESIEVDPAVEKVMHVSEPYKLANRAFHPEDSVIDVGGVKIGGGHLAVIAGPCSVESKEQVIEIAKAAKAAGANLLRGGAFKPRTSPYAFQGMGSAGLDILVAAKEATGLPIVSELMDAEYLDEFIEKVDLIQIGARNMQNFDLLKKVGKATKKPILLKRGLSATFQEWIMSAEYIMASGNPNVILCERGVRTFESYTRNTLDLQAVPVIKELTHLPIIIDPSHAGGKWWLVNPMAKAADATGIRDMVEPMALAAIAAGADGLMVEVHNDPAKALCDGPQSLKPAKFEQLMKELKKEDLQITELIHRFVREHVEAGDICIDATAGCGNDTLFLCELTGARGEVMAFDIQPQALEKTATLLAEHECMAELVLDSHSNMADYMSEGSAACIMFNFGYLPGADHKIETKAQTSIAAIKAGLSILRKGGIMTLCLYDGSDVQREEKEAILEMLKELDSKTYLVITSCYYNRPNHPPMPVFIQKLEGKDSSCIYGFGLV